MKTNQEDCALLDAKPSQEPQVEGGGEKPEDVRSAVAPDAPQAILDSKERPNSKEKQPAANTVPERIMEVADTARGEGETKAPTKAEEGGRVEGSVERAEEDKRKKKL